MPFLSVDEIRPLKVRNGDVLLVRMPEGCRASEYEEVLGDLSYQLRAQLGLDRVLLVMVPHNADLTVLDEEGMRREGWVRR